MNADEQHLKLLSIFHYVVAAMIALVACIPVIHLVIGVVLLRASHEPGATDPPPAGIGLLFIAIASCAILLGWATAIGTAFAGRSLAARRNYTFCLVMAGILCLFMPLGTVLGVFTILVLMRPSVRERFGPAAGQAAAG